MNAPLHPLAVGLDPAIAVIGGTGLYEMERLEDKQEVVVETPYGAPSDSLLCGKLDGRRVVFLPRHGRGHRLLPTELNHRANFWALKQMGVRWVLAVTAVGSLREEYEPRDVLIPDQLFDRTSRRTEHTFFGSGIVAHVMFADPYSEELRKLVIEEARNVGGRVHDRGTYVCMDGPAFSTRAESLVNRQLGFDVIGMTNLPEAKLAREAEMSLATLAMITDYDCWKVEEEPVTAEAVVGHLMANSARAKEIVRRVIPRIPLAETWPEHRVLDSALLTERRLWPVSSVDKLRPILQRFL